MSNERIIKGLMKKWLLIVIVVLFSTGFSAVYSIYTSQSIYQAKTTLYVMTTGNSQKSVITTDNIAVSQQLVKDYSELIKSEKITSAVVESLGLNGELSSIVSINIVKGSNLLQLSVTDANPEKAQAVANAFAQVLIENIVGITNQTNISVVDEAKLPVSPIATNKSLKVMLSFLLSLVAICGLIIVLEYLDNTAHTVEDIEKELGYSVIGIIPEMDIK